MCCSGLKKQFQGHLCSLAHDRPDEFAKSQWHGRGSTSCTWLFLVYRWLLALFLVASQAITIYQKKWPLKLSSLAFIVLAVQAVLSAALATKHHLGKTDSQRMSIFHKCFWFLNNSSNSAALTVTIFWVSVTYWIGYKRSEVDHHEINFFSVTSNFINSVIVIVDLFISAHPIRLLHAHHPVILYVVSIVFSGLYHITMGLIGGEKFIDIVSHMWEEPLLNLSVHGFVALLLVLFHVCTWLLFLLRRNIAVCLMGEECQPHVVGQHEMRAGVV